MKNGLIFEGETKDGLANGKGVLKSDDFHIIGDWIRGKLQGFAIITLKNGDSYEGDFKDSVP